MTTVRGFRCACNDPNALARGPQIPQVLGCELTLIFSDLFPYAERSIAWLQVFRTRGSSAVVLVTEPEDNPGQSCVNAAERLRKDVLRAFPGLGDVQIFVRFLEAARAPGWIKLVPATHGMEYQRVSVGEVEDLCPGAAQLSWDIRDHSCAALGGPRHPLLALIPAPEPPHNPVDDLAVVAVADLPWTHNPSRCPHLDRFRTIESLYPEEQWTPPVVGAQWFLTLSEQDLEQCDHHSPDWLTVAAASVEIFEGLDATATLDTIPELVTARLGNTPEAERCLSLFYEPITWRHCHTRVGDGQHRICALKAAGAPFCVVDTGGDRFGDAVAGEPARRASAEIAQFWARRAAE